VANAPGVSSGRRQSAILVPVPEADSVVGEWRLRYDPVAAAGVPAHVTLVVPWIPPDQIGSGDLEALANEVARVKAFDFSLTHVDWFSRRVLWVAPEPVGPFLALTSRLAERFDTPPWENEFDEVIPHLTVAHAADGVDLVPVATAVTDRLPIRCRAE
jgi:2'-5' RNA ligase